MMGCDRSKLFSHELYKSHPDPIYTYHYLCSIGLRWASLTYLTTVIKRPNTHQQKKKEKNKTIMCENVDA